MAKADESKDHPTVIQMIWSEVQAMKSRQDVETRRLHDKLDRLTSENHTQHREIHAALSDIQGDVTVNRVKVAGLVSMLALVFSMIGSFFTKKFWG